jgi:hypothetical protein
MRAKPTVTTVELNNVWIIDDFFTPEECEQWIAATEQQGYETKYNASIRHNGRLLLDISKEPAPLSEDEITKRLLDLNFIPQHANELNREQENGQGYELKGISSQLRFYKYSEQNRFFSPHYDFSNAYPKQVVEEDDLKYKIYAKSFITVLVYLSTVSNGGETVFFDGTGNARDRDSLTETLSIKPVCGTALLFVHSNLHEGSALPPDSIEKKYVLRTDVVYQKKKPVVEKIEQQVVNNDDDLFEFL